jgi:hypothetical protein
MTDKEEITVKVQRMFPNCEKYKPCCSDLGMEEMMRKAKRENINPIIKDILEKSKKKSKS